MLRFPVFSMTAATSATTFREGHTSGGCQNRLQKGRVFSGRKSSLPPVGPEDPPWSVSPGCPPGAAFVRQLDLTAGKLSCWDWRF